MELNDTWLSLHILTHYKFLIETLLALASLNAPSLLHFYKHCYKFSYARILCCRVHTGKFILMRHLP